MRTLLTSAAVLLVAGCSSPQAPFDVGTHQAPIALVLGEHAAVVQAPVGPISAPLPPSLAPFLPSIPEGSTSSSPGVPDVPLPSVPARGSCPQFDPRAPVAGTGITIPGPPQPATYTYRAATTDTVEATKSSFVGNSDWRVTVSPPDPTTGGYDVTVEVTIGKVTSTRVFLVLMNAVGSAADGNSPLSKPDGTDPNAQVIDLYNSNAGPQGLPTIPRNSPNMGRYGPAGIYLVSQSSAASTFKPTLPIPLLQTPVGPNSFRAIGSDGATNMTFVSTVTKKALVNACGKKVESIEISLTDGKVGGLTADGKAQVVNFSERLDFGLALGGIPVHDEGIVSAVQAPGAAAIERTFDFTVNTVPKLAKAR